MRISPTALAVLTLCVFVGATAQLQTPSPREAPRPIDAGDSLWTEELTWMEVRDAVKAGKTTVIVGTGGVEQNGPYLAGGKHNFVLATVQSPALIRAEQRIKAGLFTLHGVDLAPVSKTIELGRKLAEYRAGITARAYQNSVKRLRGAGGATGPAAAR